MKRLLLIVSFLIPGFYAYTLENHPVGARPRALSNAYISIADSWSIFHNQAGITGVPNATIGFYYESRFLVDELSLTAGSAIIPFRQGTFGMSFYQFGKGSYKENKYAIAYALPVSRKIDAAIQLDYFSHRLPENSRTKGFATFEAGLIYKPVKKFSIGVHIFNPVKNGIETIFGKEKSSATFRLGCHYQFEEMVMITLEAEKHGNTKTFMKSGIEFSPIPNLALRFGVSGNPLNYTTGIGYKVGNLTTDISFGYHGNLGITPAISIQFAL